MGNPWDPERVVSTTLAGLLIESQFPALAPVRVEPLGVGWDNSAFLINASFVFRFPRRQIAVDLIETELRVLPRLAGRLPLSIPVPEWSGRPEPRFPWPFAGYRCLPGCPASSVLLDDRDRLQIARPLAEFLVALHGVPLADAKRWGAGPDTISRLDTGRLSQQILLALDDLRARGLIDDLRPWTAIIAEAAELRPSREALLHGDLYARHLLVDERHQLCGVIDFGDVHYGDPAVDLSVVWTFLPPEARERFFDVYGEVDESMMRLARLRALMSAAAVGSYGWDVGDQALIAEGLRALRSVATV